MEFPLKNSLPSLSGGGSPFLRVFLLLFSCLVFEPAFAGFLLFGDLLAQVRSEAEDMDDLEKRDFSPRATLFYSEKFSRFRVLAEYTADDEESHLGRAKLGWDLDGQNRLWLGRLHNPSSYWRSQIHHGGYLQTTISRPAITEFEEQGGVVPAHLSGALAEGLYPQGNGGWRYYVGVGFSPTFDASGLEAPKILAGSRGKHDTSFTFRVGWQPDVVLSNEAGFFASRNHVDSEVTGIEEIEQTYGGVYFNWHVGHFILLSEVYYVDTEIYRAQSLRDNFANAYFQLGYQINNAWLLNGRLEDSWSNQGNAYLAYFPSFSYKKRILSLRYDVLRHHALKFEFERSHRQSGHTYNQLGIQWSFAFP